MPGVVRPVVPAMEALLSQDEPILVLDHGSIRVIDYMGDDDAIVQAARVSYGEDVVKIHDDRGLIRYLMRHSHTSPFEMCEIKLQLKMPIFVARQWVRHRTASINEISGRYAVLDRGFYVPDAEHIAEQSTANKQGRGEALNPTVAEFARELFRDCNRGGHAVYDGLLGGGVARELARTVLPLATYTQFVWKIDLHNLLHFLRLRMDSHAQYEIRVYADEIAKIVAAWVPEAWDAFAEYRLHGATVSCTTLNLLRQLVKDENMSVEQWEQITSSLGMSKGEGREFRTLFDLGD